MSASGPQEAVARTVVEQRIRELRMTLEEFVEYFERVARDCKEPKATLSLRHLHRLVIGRRGDGRPLGPLRPATVRVLEHIFGESITTLLAASRPAPELTNSDAVSSSGASSVLLPIVNGQPVLMPVAADTQLGLSLFGNEVSANGNSYASAMNSFRAADRQVGGGHLYATVVKYLHTEVALPLFGVETHSGGSKLVFAAAAALTEMAGWMAQEAGRDQAAEQHFVRSLDLVKIGGDRQLGVHVLASMSHLTLHRGRPAEAIQLARRGRDSLARGPRQPELEALLLAMQARGFAALRRIDDCRQLLLQAERALSALPTGERSPWVSRFDEGSLAGEAARCLHQIGDLNEAGRQAARVIELRPGDRTRSRAFGQLILATVLTAQGKSDEACAMAQQVLQATQQLGSYPVIQQLLDLKQLLKPYGANRVVADFLGSLDEALRERMWLYQFLAREECGQVTGFRKR